MKKDFDGWNEEKKKTNVSSGRFYHEREVWWCALGVNIGHEQDGNKEDFRRPILVLKALSKQTCLAVPLSTALHNHKMRVRIGLVGNKEAQAIVSQIRVVDTRRFVSRLSIIDPIVFEKVRKAAKDML